MSDIKNQKELNQLLKQRRNLLKSIEEDEKVNLKANYDKKSVLEDIAKLEKEISNIKKQDSNFLKLEKNQTKEKKEQAAAGRKTLNIEKQLSKLKKTSQGNILKENNLLQTLEKTSKAAQNTTGKNQQAFNLASQAQIQAMEDIKAGTFDAGLFMENLGEEMEALGPKGKAIFENIIPDLEDFANIAKKGGEGLSDALSIDAKDLDGLEDMRDSMKKFSAIASSPALMGAFAIGLVVKLFTDLASQANEVRQQLGLSVGESAKLGAKVSILSKGFSLLGGDGQQIFEFAKGINTEFGSINQLSGKTLFNFGLLSLRTGITGDNAAKLAKSIQNIQGGSLETSLNMISTFESMSRAAGVAPKLVLDDIAENTELFAKFAKEGGENLAKAAIEARKLGLNLSAVDKVAESLLDFESSIEAQMNAQVLLGRQLNLDKARELALSGDLEGVLAEVKNQVGGTEALSRMNVVQRKALADAVGLEVSELSKLAAGQENVNKMTTQSLLSFGAQLTMFVGIATIISGLIGFILVASRQSSQLAKAGAGAVTGAKIGAGIGLAGFGAMEVGKAMLPKLETGGMVKETGMAQVHRGEVFSGTNNQMGFGNDMTETNKLLKQSLNESKRLRSDNAALMNRLTGKVGEMALSN